MKKKVDTTIAKSDYSPLNLNQYLKYYLSVDNTLPYNKFPTYLPTLIAAAKQ